MLDMHDVIYLTGAPAAGKSSIAAGLREKLPSLQVFEYGAQLAAHITASTQAQLDQEGLRREASKVSMLTHVRAVDKSLLTFVARNRTIGPILIDTHAVTK